MRLKNVKTILLLGIFALSMSSCMSVKSYQKMYLNDEEMDLAARKLDFFEINFQTYRDCLLYTSPSPRDGLLSRMPSSA